MKKDYKNYSQVGKNHKVAGETLAYPNCTMPWQQSMLGKHWSFTYNQDDVVACDNKTMENSTDPLAYLLKQLDYEFVRLGVRLEHPSCSGNY